MRMVLFSVLLSVSIAFAASQPERPPQLKPNAPQNVVAFCERVKEAKLQEIERLEKTIDVQQNNLKRMNDRATKRKILDEIKKTKEKIKEVSSPQYASNPPLEPQKVGSIGSLFSVDMMNVRDTPVVRVVQVIDNSNAIVSLVYSTMEYKMAGGGYAPSGKFREKAVEIWLTRVDTSGWVDDAPAQNINKDALWEIAATKTYETNFGSKTVPLMQPFDISQYIDRATTTQTSKP